ncbi:MAG: hypothetical protein JWP97_391 [Labilithrix sp.]|nr:hypothetical protein [Labilithrix sp.]
MLASVDAPRFCIGRSNPRVSVRPSRREFHDATDCWDGNWVYATITIAAGAFGAEFEALLRAEELVRFRDELRPLHEKLVGRARFDTMEEWLSITIVGDGKGHFDADCVALDRPGTGNRLTFKIAFDQSDLPEILGGLDAITSAFPVIGAP